tara:strand:- start:36 stop:164 length:129 start_codon:yes stop_codon:yes gene_type:complete
MHKIAPIIKAIFKKQISQNNKLLKNMKAYEENKGQKPIKLGK